MLRPRLCALSGCVAALLFFYSGYYLNCLLRACLPATTKHVGSGAPLAPCAGGRRQPAALPLMPRMLHLYTLLSSPPVT